VDERGSEAMNIVVCLKQVPGTTKVKIDPETNTLVRQGVESVMNPFDAYALEEGVRIRERYGGKVTVISMGPPQADAMLRGAISVGADDAILLSDREFAGSDTLATSYTLSRAIKKLSAFDLVLCGRQTLDGDTGQVGPELAQMLGLPFIAYATRIEEIVNGTIRVLRMVDDGHESIETVLPAAITVTKEINVPRLPSIRQLFKAKSAKITIWTAADIGAERESIGRAGSATIVVKTFVPERARTGEILKGTADEQVQNLIDSLRKARVI
jgi:electron transfer flavoprotein beta subunit